MNSKEQQLLENLLTTLMESSLSDEEQAQLDSILKENEDAREYYNDYIDTHIALDWHFGDKTLDLPSGLEPMINQKPPRKKSAIIQFIAPLIAIAAVLTFVFLNPASKTVDETQYTLLKSVSATWDSDSKYKVGDGFTNGSHKLNSGYCELTNNKGVKIIVEGPAEFELVSE